jgi:Xaa-Pro aminopeptidase
MFAPKTGREIALMKQAAHIGDAALSRTLPLLKEGMTEREAAFLLEDHCRRLGSEKPSFDTIALFGERSALPHGTPTQRRIRKGDWVLFDFGCTVGGFASDMTRTAVFGPASPRQKKIYGIVFEAQQKAREAVREGARASSVDACARGIIEAAGWGDNFGHATGHGVGRRVHEPPRISRTNKSPLEAGAVITIEPGIYIPKFGGVRIEDMAVVRKDHGEILTDAPRELREITA